MAPTWLAVFGLLFVVAANIASIIMIFYVLALQTSLLPGARALSRLMVTGALAAPGILFALHPHFLTDNISSVLAYGGLVFCGVAAVTLVDYFLVRDQHISHRDLFDAQGGTNRYDFWWGVNFVAIAAVVGGYFFETWLMDPVSLSYHGPFRYVGASIPTVLATGAVSRTRFDGDRFCWF
ncbi:MAG: cytosine permease, partial [Thermomicrobiales bacterium]